MQGYYNRMHQRVDHEATYRKVYGAGAWVTGNARTEAPYCLQVIEELSICAHCLQSTQRKTRWADTQQQFTLLPGSYWHLFCISEILKRFPYIKSDVYCHSQDSQQLLTLTLTRWGRTEVIIDVYLSTTGGNPTSRWALQWPARFMMVWDFLHHGTKSLYSSTLATTSYISCIENLREQVFQC